MKTVQKFFVFGMLMTAALIFAGCGESDTAGSGGGGDTTPAESSEGSGDNGASEGSDNVENASTNSGSDEFQLVSLNVPKMT